MPKNILWKKLKWTNNLILFSFFLILIYSTKPFYNFLIISLPHLMCKYATAQLLVTYEIYPYFFMKLTSSHSQVTYLILKHLFHFISFQHLFILHSSNINDIHFRKEISNTVWISNSKCNNISRTMRELNVSCFYIPLCSDNSLKMLRHRWIRQ